MFLALRMVLYYLFASLSGSGLILYDQAAGTVTFQIDNLATALVGAIGFGGTFAWSRLVKRAGGQT